MNKDENGRGLLLMVQEELANIIVVVGKSDVGEIMWQVMSSGRQSIKNWNCLRPQESRTNLTKVKTI